MIDGVYLSVCKITEKLGTDFDEIFHSNSNSMFIELNLYLNAPFTQ